MRSWLTALKLRQDRKGLLDYTQRFREPPAGCKDGGHVVKGGRQVVTTPLAASARHDRPEIDRLVDGHQGVLPPVACGQTSGAIVERPRELGFIRGRVAGSQNPVVAKGDAAAAACHSFAPGTAVLTAAGAIPIADIEPGDEVIATDPATGETGPYEVTATFAHSDPVSLTVSIDGERIVTTPSHPFMTTRGWTEAQDLVPGDEVLRRDGGTGTIVALTWDRTPAVRHDLTVETAHTFFVGEGAWWVHNCDEALLGARQDLSAAMTSLLSSKAGFTGEGSKLIVDENLPSVSRRNRLASCGPPWRGSRRRS